MKNDSEIIKCLLEQINLMQNLLEEKIMAEGARVAAEIYMHRRDEHLKYWDSTYYLEGKKKQDEKRGELYKKLEENKKKIAELIKKVESGEEKLSFPPCADDLLPVGPS